MNKQISGSKAKQSGKISENLFKNACEARGIKAIRIEDGATIAAKGKVFRTSQFCDYILFFKKSTVFVDVKTFERKTIGPSFFKEYEHIDKKTKKVKKKKNSSREQLFKFIPVNLENESAFCYFVFVDQANNDFYWYYPEKVPRKSVKLQDDFFEWLRWRIGGNDEIYKEKL